ncbi:MAG: hypothetical protein E6R03_06995 [Hyphomicrobiaceae bacterium]|nr:MAG: hypothetical protein E6R03_06995 [Hyphomicrobiaceae bacterium]
MRIVYQVPDVVKWELEIFMGEMKWFVPRWVREITFFLGPETEAMAESWTSADYLTLKISLNQNWMGYTSDKRREILIHELAHAHTSPLADAVRDFGKVKLDDKDNEILREIIRHNMELCTEHLAWCAEEKQYGAP